MSSIRPLVTITILIVVGAYLYVKINEGPIQPLPGKSEAWEQPAADVPPLTTGDAAPATSTTAAPPWTATETPAPTTPAAVGASSDVAAPTTPAASDVSATVAGVPPTVPPIPEMPELATTTQAEPATTPSVPLPTELPANIPEARYPDDPSTNVTATLVDAAAGAPAGNSVAPATAFDVAASATTTQQVPTTPEQMNAATAGASDLTSPPLATQPNPLRQSPQPTDIGRYGAPAPTTNLAGVSATTAPIEPTFAASWPTIQAALDRGELAQAHQRLSRWYDDPSLTPTDAERVESLLSQLAGTVVYSTEHQLAPAHVVKPGETLETIAKEYNVPWELLAKINSIPAPDQVRPGQELKVVRGPFSAVVDLGRNQLTLMVDGRYAGRFSLIPPSDVQLQAGDWVVQEKAAVAQAPASRHLVLTSAGTANPGSDNKLLIRSGRVETEFAQVGADGQVTKNAVPSLTVSPADAAELSDILSVGSRIVIRR